MHDTRRPSVCTQQISLHSKSGPLDVCSRLQRHSPTLQMCLPSTAPCTRMLCSHLPIVTQQLIEVATGRKQCGEAGAPKRALQHIRPAGLPVCPALQRARGSGVHCCSHKSRHSYWQLVTASHQTSNSAAYRQPARLAQILGNKMTPTSSAALLNSSPNSVCSAGFKPTASGPCAMAVASPCRVFTAVEPLFCASEKWLSHASSAAACAEDMA